MLCKFQLRLRFVGDAYFPSEQYIRAWTGPAPASPNLHVGTLPRKDKGDQSLSSRSPCLSYQADTCASYQFESVDSHLWIDKGLPYIILFNIENKAPVGPEPIRPYGITQSLNTFVKAVYSASSYGVVCGLAYDRHILAMPIEILARYCNIQGRSLTYIGQLPPIVMFSFLDGA